MENSNEKRDSVIGKSTNNVRDFVKQIGSTVKDLENRLKPILGQELPEKSPETGTPASDSPLAEDLNCIAADADKIVRELENLINRLQC